MEKEHVLRDELLQKYRSSNSIKAKREIMKQLKSLTRPIFQEKTSLENGNECERKIQLACSNAYLTTYEIIHALRLDFRAATVRISIQVLLQTRKLSYRPRLGYISHLAENSGLTFEEMMLLRHYISTGRASRQLVENNPRTKKLINLIDEHFERKKVSGKDMTIDE